MVCPLLTHNGHATHHTERLRFGRWLSNNSNVPQILYASSKNPLNGRMVFLCSYQQQEYVTCLKFVHF